MKYAKNIERKHSLFQVRMNINLTGKFLFFVYSVVIFILFIAVFLNPSKLNITLAYSGGLLCLVFFLLANIWNTFINIERFLFHLVFITGFLGSALLPIYLGEFTLFPFRVFLTALWFLFTLHTLVDNGEFKVRIFSRTVRWSLIFLGLWLTYAFLSLGWAVSKIDVIRTWIFLFFGISLIVFTIHYTQNEKDFQLLYAFWLIMHLLLCVQGLYEHATGLHLPSSKLFEDPRVWLLQIPTSVFHNPNDFATFLSISAPFAISLYRYGRGLASKITGGIIVTSSFYLIVVTGSRANILAFLIGLFFILIFLTNISGKFKSVISIIFIGLLLSQILGQEFFPKINEELGSLVITSNLDYGSVAVRKNLIKNSLVFLYNTLGFGVGSGNAEYWMEHFQVFATYGITNPHNWWVEILVNYGILVFIGYIIMYFSIMKDLWEIHRKTNARIIKMTSEALLVSCIIFSLAIVSSSSIMTFRPQWYLFALALAFLNIHGKRRVLKPS